MTDARNEPLSEGWSTRQLSDFLTLVSSFEDERSAIVRLVERAVDVLEADAAILVERNDLAVAAGPKAHGLDVTEVRAVASGRRATITLGGDSTPAHCAGRAAQRPSARCRACRPSEPGGDRSASRPGSRHCPRWPHAQPRRQRRGMRASSETQAAENARLLEALRDRQVMLERLATIQRAIVAQKPLHDIFDQVVGAACELIGDLGGMVRMRDMDEASLDRRVLGRPQLKVRRRRTPGARPRPRLSGHAGRSPGRDRQEHRPPRSPGSRPLAKRKPSRRHGGTDLSGRDGGRKRRHGVG